MIARTDKLGTRPVYWSGVTVSSSLDDFVDHKPDPLGIFQALTIGFPIGRRSLLQDVQMLPPGHEISVENGRPVTRAYWLPPRRSKHRSTRESVLSITRAFDLFCETLREKTVALGLTGGKDSRLVMNALHRNGVNVTCLSWRDYDFNDRISAAIAEAVDQPHFVVKPASREEEDRLRTIALRRSCGLSRNIGFALLGKTCARLGLDKLLIGLGGDKLSPYMAGGARTLDRLAAQALRHQMELYSFAEAEALMHGKGEYTEQTLLEWHRSFEQEAWRDDIGDIALWQALKNRNYKRVSSVMCSATEFCEVVYPYAHDAVMDAYLTLPLAHLKGQLAHALAARWDIPDFGRYRSTSYPVPLKWEPSRIIDLARKLRARTAKPSPVATTRRQKAMVDMVTKLCERRGAAFPPC